MVVFFLWLQICFVQSPASLKYRDTTIKPMIKLFICAMTAWGSENDRPFLFQDTDILRSRQFCFFISMRWWKNEKKIVENITQDWEDLAYKWFNTMRHQSLPLFIITPHSSMHGNLNEAGTQEQSTSLMRPICKASVSRIMPSVDHSSRSDWCGALGLIIVKGPQ